MVHSEYSLMMCYVQCTSCHVTSLCHITSLCVARKRDTGLRGKFDVNWHGQHQPL